MVAAIPSARAAPRPRTQRDVALPIGSRVVSSDGAAISDESLERLERLDDTVFAALRGDAGALDEAGRAWRDAAAHVDARLIQQAREVYVRRARSRWRRSLQRPEERITLGFAAQEILSLLGDRACDAA